MLTRMEVSCLNERVRMVRDRLGLSRASFGEKLGVSGDVINNLERGRVEVKEPMIKLICSVYSVNEKWLRTGEGGDDAMFVQRSGEDELAAAVDRLKIGQSAEFKRRLVVALSTLKEEHWLLLEEKLKEILGAQETTKPSTTKLRVVARDGSRIETEIEGELTLPDESDEIP